MAELAYHLETLEITDFAKIVEANVELPPIAIIGGKNGAGKSSFLDAIAALFGGSNYDPVTPIHRGADRAEVKATLRTPSGPLALSLVYTDKGRRLKIVNEDGMGTDRQSKLSELLTPGQLEPLAFEAYKKQDRLKYFREKTGLDFTEIDEDRAQKFQDRADQNRTVKSLESRYEGMPKPPADTPDEEVSVSDLSAQLREANEANRVGASLVGEAERLASQAAAGENNIQAKRELIEDLKKQIEAAESKIAKWEPVLVFTNARATEAKNAAAAFVPVDTDAIASQMDNVEVVNRKVREKKARAAARIERDEARLAAEKLTNELKEIDDRKAALIAEFKMPVDGLGFDPETNDFTLHGKPWEECSTGERLTAAVQLQCRTSGKFKFVIIRDGSDLDDDNLMRVVQTAVEEGAQVIIERVTKHAEDTTLILTEGIGKEGTWKPEPVPASTSTVAPAATVAATTNARPRPIKSVRPESTPAPTPAPAPKPADDYELFQED